MGAGPGLPVRDPAMFHGLLGEIVDATDPHTEADPVGVLVALLAGVGALVGPSPHVMVGPTRHPLLIWPLIFGATSSGRKGEALAAARQYLRVASTDFDGISAGGLSSGEGLIARIKDPEEVDESKGFSQSPGTSDKRLLVTEPEFAAVMARAKREGNTLAAILREAWDGGRLGVLTKTHVKASSSHISILGQITPKEFRLRLVEADLAGGTYNRFLPVYVSRSKLLPLPKPVPQATLKALSEKLNAAIVKASRIAEIGLDHAAETLWSTELYFEFAGDDDEDAAWTDFAQRAAPYCRRVAALYAALDDRREVNEGDMIAAAALVRYSVESAQYVLSRTSGDTRLDKIGRAVAEAVNAGRVGATRTEISGLFGRNLPAPVLDELIDQLVSSGKYMKVTIPTGGRSATGLAPVSTTNQQENSND